jgi:hypothetical protein
MLSAGLNASSAQIIFLGSGPYKFRSLAQAPPRYIRPEYIPAPSASATAAAPASPGNTKLVGIVVGCVVAGVIAGGALLVCWMRRRQSPQQKLSGQALVRKWEWERRQGELTAGSADRLILTMQLDAVITPLTHW